VSVKHISAFTPKFESFIGKDGKQGSDLSPYYGKALLVQNYMGFCAVHVHIVGNVRWLRCMFIAIVSRIIPLFVSDCLV
jgi:hypothetical protein